MELTFSPLGDGRDRKLLEADIGLMLQRGDIDGLAYILGRDTLASSLLICGRGNRSLVLMADLLLLGGTVTRGERRLGPGAMLLLASSTLPLRLIWAS